MTAAVRLIDIVIDAIERGESPVVVVLPDPADAACHPGKPGTNGRYNGGCKCAACRAAHVAYARTRPRWRRAS